MIVSNAISSAAPVSAQSATAFGLQTGETQTASQLGEASTQAATASKLLASLTGIGQHIDLKA